ncbi:RodZ domain-containing protein [Undibacterium sp.]|uniref:RodZ domain-containing protein n=1 Tax=Undibacterium sp. TaxID=1914977 RepID=UPI00273042C4|nr:RodZ domain-containing protein [Undibacterium sp.]MDP1979310.1 DUF4115 domain-containing protein [Undibacterium sp.]
MSEAGANLPVEPLPSEMSEHKTVLCVVQTAGSQLSAARSQMGLSLQQVADQLKLSQRQISALENNQFDDLPKMVIVRGFVRSYAKLLKLDPAPIISCLPAEVGLSGLVTDMRPTLATPFMESRTPFLGRQDSNNRKYLIGAGLLAACALIFLVVQKLEQSDYFKNLLTSQTSGKSVEVASEKMLENAEPTQVNTVVVKPVAPVLPTVVATVNDFKPEARDQVASQSQVTENEQSASNAVIAPQTVVPLVPSVTPVADSANNQLKLKFRQDSWIQVKRENGSIVTSHLAKAGTEEVFDMKEALQLRIGNAGGVDGWLRGKSMEIAPGKDSNVINMNVK